jgi:hypothetical protein
MPTTIDGEELKRHVISSTRGYWSVRHGPLDAKLSLLDQIATHSLKTGAPLQALASYRIINRLTGRTQATIATQIDNLERAIEASAPLAGKLPAGFRVVRDFESDYGSLSNSDFFTREEMPLRTTAFGQRAYGDQFGAGTETLSFILLRQERAVAHVRACVTLDRGGTDFGMPIRVECAKDLPNSRAFHVVEVALDILKTLALRYGACDIHVVDSDIGATETAIGRAAYVRNFLPEIHVSPMVDLTKEPEEITSAIRDSYRALIRKGEKSVTLKYCNAREKDETALRAWRDLLVAANSFQEGRIEREVAYAQEGHAEIAVGFLANDQCCGISVVRDDAGCSLYEIGNYPAYEDGAKYSHFFLHDAILRSKARGNLKFFLAHQDEAFARFACPGEILTQGKKYRDIEFFKRGFANTVTRTLSYRLVL